MPDFIKKLLQNKIRNLQIDNRGDATANAIRKMLGQCPACEGKSTEHWYAPFAITIATEDTKDKLLHFFTALKEHRWQDAQLFQDFDPLVNAAEASALRCNNDVITMLLIRDPFELWEPDTLLGYDILDVQESEKLNSIIAPDKWKRVQF